MQMTAFNANDMLGFAGVAILLAAFLLNLLGKISKDRVLYISLNILGAGIACYASLLIHYMPFVILEGTWMAVSFFALLKLLSEKRTPKA